MEFKKINGKEYNMNQLVSKRKFNTLRRAGDYSNWCTTHHIEYRFSNGDIETVEIKKEGENY